MNELQMALETKSLVNIEKASKDADKESIVDAIYETFERRDLMILDFLLQHEKINGEEMTEKLYRYAIRGEFTVLVKFFSTKEHKSCDPGSMIEYAASENKSALIIEILLNFDIDQKHLTNGFITAMSRGKTNIARCFLNNPRFHPNAACEKALTRAIERGLLPAVDLYLVDSRFDSTTVNNAALFTIIEYGNYEMVKKILQDPRIDPSVVENRIMRYAINREDVHIIKLLLEDGRVDPSVNDNEAIKIMAFKEEKSIIKLLLEDPRISMEKLSKPIRNFISDALA